MTSVAAVFLSIALSVPALADPPVEPQPSGPCGFVFIVSVDGLRSDAIPAGGPDKLPYFHRMLKGSTTFNARTDPDYTITLPNHTCMITGRPVKGPDGHEWTGNTDPPTGMTIQQHAHKDIASVFDVAHQHGVHTGAFYGKTKFGLWPTSFNTGRSMDEMAIDRAAVGDTMADVTDSAVAAFNDWTSGLVFIHYADTDLVGHSRGWDITPGSAYMETVTLVDAQLGRLFAVIDADGGRHGRIGVILTTDHGGGFPLTSHIDPKMWTNYIIPFMVWVGDDAPMGDLYEINAGVRRDPSLSRPPLAAIGDQASERAQPIRNGEAGNVALSLLGLPAIPGSTLNAHQDLRILWPPALQARDGMPAVATQK